MRKEKRGENICSREAPFFKGTGDQEQRMRWQGRRVGVGGQYPEEAISFQSTWLVPENHWQYRRLQPDSQPAFHCVLVTIASFLPLLLKRSTFLRREKKHIGQDSFK